jgi:uncharacterized membrane protein YkvA (DUF1232 family)
MSWNLHTRVRLKKRVVHAFDFESRDFRAPWHAKALAVVVGGYAISAIDLIPDFISVLGYLDDVVILPLSRAAAALIVLLWIVLPGFAGLIAFNDPRRWQ